MPKKSSLLLLLLLLLASLQPSYSAEQPASAADKLKHLLHSIQSIVTQFEQRQWALGAGTPTLQKGQFLFQQPNKFHWVYSEPFQQEYVADGETVYIYDQDLEQGIIRAQKDFSQFVFSNLFNKNYPLDQYYRISETTDSDTLQAFLLLSRDTQHSPVHSIQFNIRDHQIESIDIIDALNQRTLITLIQPKINIPILKSSFQFQWPVGIDVFDERNSAQ